MIKRKTLWHKYLHSREKHINSQKIFNLTKRGYIWQPW
nr:MAG TPA: hypothetical protein [Caudoviricetes sp.]